MDNNILQLVIAQNMENIALFLTGVLTTPLVVLAGTNLSIELRRWRNRRKARAFLRTARPTAVDKYDVAKYLKK